MKHSWSIWAALSFVILLAGCGAPPEAEEAPAEHAAASSPGGRAPSVGISSPWTRDSVTAAQLQAPPDLLAWTAGGDLALVDGRSGVARQMLVTLHSAGDRDVVYDAVRQRAWVAEADVDAPDGEVASYPIAAGAAGAEAGARAFEGATGGGARLLASGIGTVVFEDAGAWRLIAGGASSAAIGPRPMSAWLTANGAGIAVRALAYGPSSGELDVAAAALSPGSIAPVAVEVAGVEAGSLPPSARVVPAPARGGALLLDVEGSFLVVRALGGGAAARVPLGAAGLRIEAAVSLHGGAVVAALLSGMAEIVAVQIDPPLAVASMARLALPGQPAPATRFFSHDLVLQGKGRLAAATSAGVFSVRVWRSAIGVQLAMDGAFPELRGPIAAIWPPPF